MERMLLRSQRGSADQEAGQGPGRPSLASPEVTTPCARAQPGVGNQGLRPLSELPRCRGLHGAHTPRLMERCPVPAMHCPRGIASRVRQVLRPAPPERAGMSVLAGDGSSEDPGSPRCPLQAGRARCSSPEAGAPVGSEVR